jgi:hypothetical protein
VSDGGLNIQTVYPNVGKNFFIFEPQGLHFINRRKINIIPTCIEPRRLMNRGLNSAEPCVESHEFIAM